MSERKSKIVMLGSPGVGKTSLVVRWTKDSFRDDQSPTIGAAYSQKVISLDGEQHKVQIWDTSGEEKYRSMAPIYCQGAAGALVLFDFTRRDTLDAVDQWIGCLETVGRVPVVLVGNKHDLYEEGNERMVSAEEANEKAEALGVPFFATSASTGYGVDGAFLCLVGSIAKSRMAQPPAEDTCVRLNEPRAGDDPGGSGCAC